MFIAKVVGNLWATRKEDTLVGRKLMIVEPAKLDGIGEMVIVAQGSSARKAVGQQDSPVDAAIVAIIDIHEVQGK